MASPNTLKLRERDLGLRRTWRYVRPSDIEPRDRSLRGKARVRARRAANRADR